MNRYVFESCPTIVRQFAEYKATLCAENTVDEYMLVLRMFSRYLLAVRENRPMDGETFEHIDVSWMPVEAFSSVKPEDIDAFVEWARDVRGNKGAALARKATIIRSFYKYCVAEARLFKYSPAAYIEIPKQESADVSGMDVDECKRLLLATKAEETPGLSTRNVCIVTLFLNAGLKLSELVGINCADIDWDRHMMTVNGRRKRAVYLNEACMTALSQYMEQRHLLTDTGEDESGEDDSGEDAALFLSWQRQRISPKTVQFVIKKYKNIAKLGKVSAKTLRDTAANLIYEKNDVNLFTLKEILGHVDAGLTQKYVNDNVPDSDISGAMSGTALDGRRYIIHADKEGVRENLWRGADESGAAGCGD